MSPTFSTLLDRILGRPSRLQIQPFRPGVEQLESRLVPTTYVVNSTSDLPDPTPNDGIQNDVDPATPGNQFSLRGAIQTANSHANTLNAGNAPDEIVFNIGNGVQTITPRTSLPTVTDPVIIDGRTAPGKPQQDIVLDGGNRVGTGITITSGKSTVRNLAILSFRDAGIELANRPVGEGFENTGGSVIEGNYIGRDKRDAPGGGNGSGIVVRSSGNTIGGTANAQRNVISGNRVEGIDIDNDYRIDSVFVEKNVVIGNYIGTDLTGSLRRSNGVNGISITNSNNNTIGGAKVEARNLISGNNANGIFILGTRLVNGVLQGNGNVVLGNFIGTDKTGNALLRDSRGQAVAGNGSFGVFIFNATGNVIGGDKGLPATQPNVISGNDEGGVRILTGNLRSALTAFQVGGNTIQHNYIGTSYTGLAALGNGADGDGILIDNAIRQTVQNNLISGNRGLGIHIDVDGDDNGFFGRFENRPIEGDKRVNNLIAGNTIGLDVNQAKPLANGTQRGGTAENSGGVRIDNSSNNLLVGNVVSANKFNGVSLVNRSRQNVLRSNLIGTDGTGKAIAAGLTPLGNAGSGVFIERAPDNLIGGVTDDLRNTISGNGKHGIEIVNLGSTNNVIARNNIGTDKNGHVNPAAALKLGNAVDGVTIAVGVKGTKIKNNQIAYNGGKGVKVSGESTLIADPNSIFGNGGLGIDLVGGAEDSFGTTENDATDTDGRQNYPVLEQAVGYSGSTQITFTLHSRPGEYFLMEFFASPDKDPSGHGEGQTFIGSEVVLADTNGDVHRTLDVGSVAPGSYITATATSNGGAGSTSEFSKSILVNMAPVVTDDCACVEQGGGVTVSVLANDADPDGDALTVRLETGPAHGTVVRNADNTFTYTASSGFSGVDTFTYTADDGRGGAATATVMITVSPQGLYLVPGEPGESATLTFTFDSREAGYRNIFGYALADSVGTVAGVAPATSGYAQAVLANGFVVFDDRTHLPGATAIVEVPAGAHLVFFLVQNASVSEFLAQNPNNDLAGNPHLFYSLTGANPDAFAHLLRADGDACSALLRWEDLTGGGDRDFNDMVIRIAASH